MRQRYRTNCKCGNSLKIDFEVGSNGLQIHCQCGELLVEYLQDKPDTVLDTLHELYMSQESGGQTVKVDNPTQDKAPSVEELPASQLNLSNRTGGQFGEFTLLRKLGKGGMAKVYLACDKTGEKMALKVLNKPDNSEMISRFIREAQLLSQIDHANIVKIKRHGNYHGIPYLAMEYVQGKTLMELVEIHGAIRPASAAQIVYYIVLAIEYAASKNFVHRDIKPQNVFVTDNGQVKVIDLGLGKVLDDSYELTLSGQMMGSPYYMPCEQIDDAKKADVHSDIYATGATLFFLLCGKHPYQEYGSNIYTIINAKREERYNRLAKHNPQLPGELLAIVEKAMAHEPSNRYLQPADMRMALAVYLRKLMTKK